MRKRQDGKRRPRHDNAMQYMTNTFPYMVMMETNLRGYTTPTGGKTSLKDSQMRDQVTRQICPRNPCMMIGSNVLGLTHDTSSTQGL